MFNNQVLQDKDDVFYYNCLSYGNADRGAPSAYATFEESRTQPFVLKPQDYFLSIVRFSIDASNVPLFVCPVIKNPNNINDINFTPFKISFIYNNIVYSENLRYIPNDTAKIPNPPDPSQDLTSDYYYVYYYSIMIKMINEAIITAFNRVINDNVVLSGVPNPYALYNPDTQKISLVFPNVIIGGINLFTVDQNLQTTNYPDTPPPTGKCYFYVNHILYPYLEGIEAFVSNYFIDTHFLIIVSDNLNNYYYPPQNKIISNPTTQTALSFNDNNINYTISPNWFIFTQQYKHVSAWNSIASIVFLSNMPIQHEFIPSFSLTNNGTNTNQYIGSSSMPILTDFVPDITEAGEQRTRFNYIPTGPYRLMNINSTVPLNQIQFSVYWMDKFQNLYPMRISYGQINSVKFMFIKKSFYKTLSK